MVGQKLWKPRLEKVQLHSPWHKESKLTRILQDSLGGRSRALMVACLNPGEYQESVYTVKLAIRSHHIPNFISLVQKQETPTVKVDMEAKLQSWIESKGKTKSSQKYGAYRSPCVSRTPMSASRNKMLSSSLKLKTNNQSASNCKERTLIKPRNLYNRGDLVGHVSEDFPSDSSSDDDVTSESSVADFTNFIPKLPASPSMSHIISIGQLLESWTPRSRKSYTREELDDMRLKALGYIQRFVYWLALCLYFISSCEPPEPLFCLGGVIYMWKLVDCG